MDSSRECRCAISPHPACASCGSFIQRRVNHVHIHTSRAKPGESICGPCWEAVCVAALPVMRAADSLGVEPTASAIHDALLGGFIQIWGQQFLN